MRKSQVINHFGTATAAAEALGITVQAISQWPEDAEGLIPEGSAYKAESVTNRKLRVNARLYRRGQGNSKRAGSALTA